MVSSARTLLRAIAQRAAKRYVVGPELDDALAASRQLAARGFTTTICAWNDEQSPPETNAERCVAGVNALTAEQLDCYVSFKALDLQYSLPLVDRLAESALRGGVGLHFDSMGPDGADQTFSIARRLGRAGVKLGCTVPGRWRRSLDDAERIADLGLRVRVVKGQWSDPQEPDIDPRAGFARVIERLAGTAGQVAVATHDPGLARAALQQLRESGTSCELELLFGLPFRAAIEVGRDMGVPIRIYLPYGHAWLPYALRQVTRKPGIAWWTLRDLLGGRAGLVPRQGLGL